MNIGEFNEQVECYGVIEISDGAGGFRSREELLFTDWAKVERNNSNRYASDNQQRTVNGYIITMRSRLDYSATVDGNDYPPIKFIKYRGRELSVIGDPLEENRDFVKFAAVQR